MKEQLMISGLLEAVEELGLRKTITRQMSMPSARLAGRRIKNRVGLVLHALKNNFIEL